MPINKIGNRLKHLREQKKVTQADVAKALHVKRQTVNQWENDERDLKTQYTISLADYYGITCDYILRGVTSENVDIHKRLGLSDRAIEGISRLFSHRYANGENLFINMLFSIEGNNRPVLDDLLLELQTIFSNYIIMHFNKQTSEKDTTKKVTKSEDLVNMIVPARDESGNYIYDLFSVYLDADCYLDYRLQQIGDCYKVLIKEMLKRAKSSITEDLAEEIMEFQRQLSIKEN